MQAYTIHWVNHSFAKQDWIVSNGTNFLLRPEHARLIHLYPEHDYNYIIAVSANNAYTTANLNYNAATQTWSLNSHTTGNWQLFSNQNTVTISCFLNGMPHKSKLINLSMKNQPKKPAICRKANFA